MMYESKMTAAIKVNGRVLREFKDTVYIPYGSEYSILIKNLNVVRAVVRVFIDGEDQVPGGLVVEPGKEVDFERSVKTGNISQGNRFKFIERTGAVEQHRGVKLEDGIIRLEYQFELPRPLLWGSSTVIHTPRPSQYPGVTDKYTLTASGSLAQANIGGALRGVDYTKGAATYAAAASAVDSYCAQNGIPRGQSECHDGAATMDMFNDAGITVPGSMSNQQFTYTSMGPLESTKHSMVFKLLGDIGQTKVQEPVTVKSKPKCVTCGKQNKATAKFCSSCGTALEIFA